MKVVKLNQSHLEELRIYFLNMLFTYGNFEFVKICMAHLLYSYTSFYFYVSMLKLQSIPNFTIENYTSVKYSFKLHEHDMQQAIKNGEKMSIYMY